MSKTFQFKLAAALLLVATIGSGTSVAQTGNFLVPGKPREVIQSPGSNAATMVHRNSFGRPCLEYEARSRPQMANPSIYDNVVVVTNKCLMRIGVKLCYQNSQDCVDTSVPSMERKDVVIGVRLRSEYFRYSFKEKF